MYLAMKEPSKLHNNLQIYATYFYTVGLSFIDEHRLCHVTVAINVQKTYGNRKSSSHAIPAVSLPLH